MSNTQYDPRPQGQPGQQGQPQYAAQPQPAAQKPEASFFRWIRESRVERTNDRVIAGVCGAIALELGWNVTLVRVLMVVAFFLGGFGAVLYGICWLLLPDELDHRILLEEVIDGHWDWSFVGVILCILIGGFSGFGFLWWGSWSVNMGAFLFAALAFFLLVDNGRRRFAVRGAAQPGNPPTTPPANMPYGGAMPQQPAANGAAYAAAAPAAGAAQPDHPFRPDMYMSGGAPVDTAPDMPSAAPAYAAAPQPSAPQPNVPPTYVAPPSRPAPVKTMRRKPAGPTLVLLVLGLLIVSMGVCSFAVNNTSLVSTMQPGVLYAGAVCVVLGVVIIVLGCAGRRTGGLHPFAWIAMFVAVCAMAVGGAWTAVNVYKNGIDGDYTPISVAGGNVELTSSADDWRKLERGIAVTGDDYRHNQLSVNLSGTKKHTVWLNDGHPGTSTCPTGHIPMTVTNARVIVTIPDGCSWKFASGDATYPTDMVGGPYTFMSRGSGLADVDVVGWDNENIVGYTHVRMPGIEVEVGDPDDRTDVVDEDADDEDDADDESTWVDTDDMYFTSRRMADLCTGVSVTKGKVDLASDANAQMKQLIESDRYWPCAASADKAPKEAELVIEPNVLISGGVSVRYASQR